MKLPKNYRKLDIRLNVAPSNYVMYAKFKRNMPDVVGSFATWSFISDKPLLINATKLLGPAYIYVLLQPGDSIVIEKKGKEYVFSGRGFEQLQLLSEMDKMQQKQLPENSDYTTVRSLNDFLEWNQYSDKVSSEADSLFSIYESRIAYDAFNCLKEWIYSQIEFKRLTKFGVLVYHQDTLQVNTNELDEVFDSFIENKNIKWLRSYANNPSNYFVYYDLVRRQVQRKYHFEINNDTLQSAIRKIEYADLIEQQYKGFVAESCLTYLVADQGLKEHVFKDDGGKVIVDMLLKRYYAKPGYESFKIYMRHYEAQIHRMITEKMKQD